MQATSEAIKIEKRGGARPNSGPKKGTVYKKNELIVQRKQQSHATLKMIEEQIQSRASKLIDSQFAAAVGTFRLMKWKKKVGFVPVYDEEEINELLATGESGVDYRFLEASAPDWKAADALLNRGFGKAKESVVHSGGIGVFHIIKNLENSDEMSGGAGED